ncbi:hypothetical protein CPB83DRAFT_844539 [Crepidotus variabilis]|uniref:Uncharacterized protein n=1 Tax=Crepidotus variabilis TaxID=179855 RepID=A0A9P6ES04_9AGAR|nr:hypothetical protein CPB83DRAFT_844539 [Crepidotus variabilis]
MLLLYWIYTAVFGYFHRMSCATVRNVTERRLSIRNPNVCVFCIPKCAVANYHKNLPNNRPRSKKSIHPRMLALNSVTLKLRMYRQTYVRLNSISSHE